MAPKADEPNSLLVPGFADQHLLFLRSASPIPLISTKLISISYSSDQHQADHYQHQPHLLDDQNQFNHLLSLLINTSSHQLQPPLMISTKLISLSLFTSSDQHIVILLMDYSCMPNIRPHRYTVDSIIMRSFLISCTCRNIACQLF